MEVRFFGLTYYPALVLWVIGILENRYSEFYKVTFLINYFILSSKSKRFPSSKLLNHSNFGIFVIYEKVVDNLGYQIIQFPRFM
jgi:hypothetical protein